jgi:MFS transporter, DHA1 family, inner membrane transport protein
VTTLKQDRSGRRTVIVAASSLALVWPGDSLLYVVLPLYASSFGVDTAMVGVLLAVNRVVRIVGYGWVAPLARKFGGNVLIACACAGAAASTIAYGATTGFVALLTARLVWGLAYGVLNLTTIAYAYGEGRNAGLRVGLNRALSTLGQVFGLGAGGWLVSLVGPQAVFVAFGVVGMLAVPLALKLPPLHEVVGGDVIRSGKRWNPSPLNLLFFVIAFAADGVFTATISTSLSGLTSISAALIGAGLLLALQRLVIVLIALIGGAFIDRCGAMRLLLPSGIAVVFGLAGIGAGQIYAAAVVLIVARALLAVLGPVLAAQQSPTDRIGALAAYTTWNDCGLAAGAFLGTLAVAWAGHTLTYAVLSVATIVALGWHVFQARSSISPQTESTPSHEVD